MSAWTGPARLRRWGVALLTAAVVSAAAPADAAPGATGRVAFGRNGDIWTADHDGTDEARLTSGPHDDRWPRWSPEGNRIAVVRDGDLVLLRADGTLLRVLTDHAGVLAAPSWSPDGRRLVYVRAGAGIAVVEATQAGSNGTVLEVGTVTSVAWNPLDSDEIAYTDGGAIFTVAPDGSDPGVELAPPDPDGRTRDQLAWDPQAGQIVFTSTGADGTRIEGAGVAIDGWTGDDRSAAWLPDGRHMLFTREGTLHLYARDPFPGGGRLRSLGREGETADGQPALVGSAAAYETAAGTQIFFNVRPLAAGPTTVTYQTAGDGSAEQGSDYAAANGAVTTPDASGNPVAIPVAILGDATPEADESFFVDFTFPSDAAAPLRVRGTILNDDGGRNGVITYTSGQAVFGLDPVRGLSAPLVSSAGTAAFSPDGQRLAYLTAPDANGVSLVVADVDGVPQATFPLSGPLDDEIAWSPDGARLAWTIGATLWVADPGDAGSATAVATDALAPSWSSDAGPAGRRIAFARPSTGMVCTVREDGSDQSCLTSGAQPRWSPDNTTIAFLRGDVSVVLVQPDGTGERVAAAVGPGGGRALLRWSPRGGSFAVLTAGALWLGREGTAPVAVEGLPPSLWAFEWSPDANQLVVEATSQLWTVGPDDAGQPFAAVRQVTAEAGGTREARWSSTVARPVATLAPRGGIERFGQARVEVELDTASPATVTVSWETVDTGSATPGVDFMPGAGTVTLQPGQTKAAIAVAVLDDALEEGPESFDVRVTGLTGARPGPASQVRVTIADDDGPPTAVGDLAGTAVATPVDIDVLANDSDPDGDPLSLTAVTVPVHGTATVTGGIVTYSPEVGFDGVDHFRYTVSDGNGHAASGLVLVYVGEPLPPAPVLTVSPALLDFGTVPLNKTKDLVVTVTNDTAQPVALAALFALEQGAPQPFDASDFEGCLSAAARILDPGESCTQKVRFWSVSGADAASPATARLLEEGTLETLATLPLFASVGPPDTGPNRPPVAADDLTGVAPGFVHTLDAVRNDSDPDHDILRITAVSDPPHGTASVVPCHVFPQNPNADCVRYVPDTGSTGIDSFLYAVSDGRGGHASATFHIAVGNVVPQVTAVTPGSGPPAGGQAIRITGSNFVYGSSVMFRCPGGDLPVTVSQLDPSEILAVTPPAPAGTCAVRVLTRFGHLGELANAYTYTSVVAVEVLETIHVSDHVAPAPALMLEIAETIQVADGVAPQPALMLEVAEAIQVSDAVTAGATPVAHDGTATTNEDTPVPVALGVGDAGPFTLAIVDGPAQGTVFPPPGTVVPAGTVVTYRPAPDAYGPDSFTFKATNAHGDSNVATILIAVAPVPDAPAAVGDGPYLVAEGQTFTLAAPGVLANDRDADLDPLSAHMVTEPAHGTVTLTASGGFTYVPAAGYFGPDSFTYVATDGLLQSGPATVSIAVRPSLGHETVTVVAVPGATVTTDTEGDGATPDDVLETTVLTPPGGTVTIEELLAPPPPPTAFTMLEPQARITAPPATAGQPLVLTFLLDGGVLPDAATVAALAVFRDGVEVAPCSPGAPGAAPDPCLASRQELEGDLRLRVRTSRASRWTFGLARSTTGLATGALRPAAGGTVSFVATRLHGQLVGALSYQRGNEQFLALRLSAFAVEDDGQRAWLAGVGVDGRTFLASVEDNGGTGDVFRLWIGGVGKTGDGGLASGQVVVAGP